MATKLARVLFAHSIGTLALAPNDLISGEADQIKALEDAGVADTSKGAVDYCKSLGKSPIAYEDPDVTAANEAAAAKAAAIKALSGEVALLEKNLASAKDEEKDALTTELKAKQAELDALVGK